MLCSLLASAGDGLQAVGANVILLPSNYWDGDIEWKAWTWVYNSGNNYGSPYDETNSNYNVVCGMDENGETGPKADANGIQWYEPGFDMSQKDGDLNYNVQDELTGDFMPILWEEHAAPFSSDATFGGRTSYQWTTNNIMADIYVRRTFTTDQLLSGPVYLTCGHDDAPCEYYINGVLVFQKTGYEGERIDDNGVTRYDWGWNNAEYVLLTDEQKELIKLNGEENTVAFHVHQNWGGAYADCGLYTKLEGGLDMGYTTPWEGKVLFNNTGGYNRDGASPSNNPRHPWSPLYIAQEGDEYTFLVEGSSNTEDTNDDGDYIGIWAEQLHFKSAIKIQEDHNYDFKVTLKADKPMEAVIVKLTDNNDDEIEWAYQDVVLNADEEQTVELNFDGSSDVTDNNFKIAFDFGGGQDSTTVTIKNISLVDNDDEEVGQKELWVGTHFFDFFDMHKRVVKYYVWDDTLNDGAGDMREAKTDEEIAEAIENGDVTYSYESVNAPEITGLTESLAWTEADFDDSMWDNQMMPTGSSGYMAEQQSIWPRGILADTEWSSNYWIRRNFELDKINERLEYQLNVCHDDVYETYVNGHLLQKNVGWTNGKNPVQVHIPARFLNVGKNVIATYIQQNWGGYFYDCGINVTEVNYDECLKQFNDALALAKADTLLTNKMWADIDAIVAQAQQFYEENKNDAAELRSYARDSIGPKIKAIQAYSSSVKTLKDTYDICRKLEDNGYWGTALTDAVAALDTCATASQHTPFLNALRDGRKAAAMERHTEKYVGSVPEATTTDNIGLTPIDDPSLPRYYIYNVGAKNFLGGGEAWGTHLALEYISNPMMLIQATKDVVDEDGEVIDTEDIEGAYYIETFRPNVNIGEMDFMNWGGFVDTSIGADNNKWEIIPVEGKENVFYIAQYGQTFPTQTVTDDEGNTTEIPGGKKLLGLRGDNGDNTFAPSYYIIDTDCKTPELETNQWMFITREELLSFIPSASTENPVDLSFLIDNPGYDQRLSTESWVFYNGSVFGRGGNHANFVLESYNSDEFANYQDMWPDEGEDALPAGVYQLTVQGYYRDGIEQKHVEKVLNHEPILQRSLIYAASDIYENDPEVIETMPLMPIHIEANQIPGIGYTFGGMSMPGTYSGQPYSACDQAAVDYFACGLYQNKLYFTIPEDESGHLAIGIVKEYSEDRLAGDWIVMDNWRLKYLGAGEIDPDAIKGIESDEIKKTSTASKGIYNLLGQRLQKAQQGVNIVGGKKVIKK